MTKKNIVLNFTAKVVRKNRPITNDNYKGGMDLYKDLRDHCL